MSNHPAERANCEGCEPVVDSSVMQFRVHGMDCAEEVSTLKRELGPLVGGAEHLDFDVLRGRLTVLPSATHPLAEPEAEGYAIASIRGFPSREASGATSLSSSLPASFA